MRVDSMSPLSPPPTVSLEDIKHLSTTYFGGTIMDVHPRLMFYNSNTKPTTRQVESLEGLWSIEAEMCSFFASLSVKLTDDQLQPLLDLLLRTMRGNRVHMLSRSYRAEPEESVEEDVASGKFYSEVEGCRMFSLIIVSLVVELRDLVAAGIIEKIGADMAHILKACVDNAMTLSMRISQETRISISSSNSTKRRKVTAGVLTSEMTWWWFELGVPALSAISSCTECVDGPISDAALDDLLPPIADCLDVLAVLPKMDYHSSVSDDTSAVWFGSVTQVFLSIASGSQGDTTKLEAVLKCLFAKCQAQNVNVRLGAVSVLGRLWDTIGTPMLQSLSYTLPILVELLEDVDQSLENATRKLIKTIEQVTGESLQPKLNL